MVEAPTCTVGPSRPAEAPHTRPSSSRTILPTAMRSETRRARAGRSSILWAAITCGMPLPWAPGKKPRVSQAASAKPPGAEHEGRPGPAAHHEVEQRLRPIGQFRHGDRKRADREPADQEQAHAAASAATRSGARARGGGGGSHQHSSTGNRGGGWWSAPCFGRFGSV